MTVGDKGALGWLVDTTALITGGASGLGRAIAERFLAEGAKVAVMDKSVEALKIIEHELGVMGIHGDVRDLQDNHTAVAKTCAELGKLDTLIANAGIWDWGVAAKDLPLDKVDEAFHEVFDVNVKGYLFSALAAREALAATQGSITFTLSNAAFHPGGGGVLYTASKHAVVGLIKQLASEFAPTIRVNGVAPAAIPTDLRGPRALNLDNRTLADTPLKKIVGGVLPLPFLPSAEDYTAHYVLLAAKQQSRTMTGSVIECDCGFAIR